MVLSPQALPLDGGINFRDLGGYSGIEGRKIKSGLLFRSGALNELTDKDCHYLSDLGVTHIVDYRDPPEQQQKPDVIWPGAVYHNIPANPSDTLISADLEKISNKDVSQVDIANYLLDLYRLLPFNNPAYRFLADLLCQPQPNSVLQHCAVGKDRTGIGSAMVLFALGASYQTVMQDYLLTEVTLAPFRQRMVNYLANTLDEQAMTCINYMFSAREEFLDTAVAQIKQRYQTIDHWLAIEFNLTTERRQILYQHYLTE